MFAAVVERILVKFALSLTVLLPLIPLASPVAQAVRLDGPSTNAMYAEIERRLDTGLQRWRRDRDGRTLTWLWAIGGIRAATEVYRATGERRFIHVALDGCADIIDERDVDLGLRDEVTGVSAPTWGSMARPEDGEGPWVRIGEVTVTGSVFAACLRALQEVSGEREALRARYVQAAYEGMNYIDMHWCEFWSQYKLCYIPTGIEPLNHWARYGDMLVQLYEMTKDPEVLAGIDGFTSLMQACMREVGGSMLWDYRPSPEDCLDRDYVPAGEWFYKSRSTTLFPFSVYRAGLGFSEEYLRKVAARFDEFVHGATLCRRIAGACEDVQGRPNRHSTVALWMRLLPYNKRIKPKLIQLLQERPDIFPNGWLTSVWTIRAYARMLQYENGRGPRK